MNREIISDFFRNLQDEICKSIEETDSKEKFLEDLWQREGGGGGRSRVIQNGKVMEKGGVNFSAVHGVLPDTLVKSLDIRSSSFYATGLSIVMHPVNPFVPIIHMNIRYFELQDGTSWFGGGIDLTPHYIQKKDAVFFHTQLKQICSRYQPGYYSKFKKWADEYFFIKHRNETRGIGGIFFDKLQEEQGISMEERFEFVKSVGNLFAPVYLELIRRNKEQPYTEEEKRWQLLRRGRYVEFNLVYDKGTRFGLETDGRTESILMSLPPQANWTYNYIPIENSKEEQTLKYLKKGINWVDEN